MRTLMNINVYKNRNKKFYDVLRYYLVRKEFDMVQHVLRNASAFKISSDLQKNISELFLLNPNCNEMFGISEIIVNTMKNITFSGNINIKVDHQRGQKIIDKYYYDGKLLHAFKELYKYAITNQKAYLVFNTIRTVFENTGETQDRLISFDVFSTHEVEKKYLSTLDLYEFTRTLYMNGKIVNGKQEVIRFEYKYIVDGNKTYLTIKGYNDENDMPIEDERVKDMLEITETYVEFDYVPIFELDLEESMLPNILNIEDALAEIIYFQREDLSNSQTHTYTPENLLTNIPLNDYSANYHDRYKTKHIVKQSIDKSEIQTVKGESAIDNIKQNLLLNILRACIDAKISPASISYSLLDSISNNTDVGINKERTTIRLRENHINILKIVFAKIITQLLKIDKINVAYEKVTLIFDPYITPSVETTTNVLAKQVQFGLKSREQAVRDLNKNELSDEEIELEIERIKGISTQVDFGVNENKENPNKAVNNLKNPDKVDNNLKSDGIEE